MSAHDIESLGNSFEEDVYTRGYIYIYICTGETKIAWSRRNSNSATGSISFHYIGLLRVRWHKVEKKLSARIIYNRVSPQRERENNVIAYRRRREVIIIPKIIRPRARIHDRDRIRLSCIMLYVVKKHWVVTKFENGNVLRFYVHEVGSPTLSYQFQINLNIFAS